MVHTSDVVSAMVHTSDIVSAMVHTQLVASCRCIMRITTVETLSRSVLYIINSEHYVNFELVMVYRRQ